MDGPNLPSDGQRRRPLPSAKRWIGDSVHANRLPGHLALSVPLAGGLYLVTQSVLER